ncbi:MAG: TldD/PmbA family protein, partial [Nitrospirota bacterium]|nr:TldD/PmbA family protein [Nitrospirota bacterium]
MSDERKFAEEILNLAINKGSDVAEVYIKSSKKLSIEVKNQKIDALESSLSFGYSLRVIKERSLGFSYSTDRDNINSVVDDAVEAARCADKDEYLEMPEAGSPMSVDIFDPRISAIEEDEAVKKVCILENAAYEVDKRIKKIRKALGTFSHADIVIMNSNGINTHYSSTACIAQIMAVAENGIESQMGWDFAGSRFLDEVSFEDVGQNAARRAVQLLGSRRISTVKAHVILDRSVAADFMEVFSSSLSSEHVQKGKSLLAGKIGKKVLSPKINIVDDGLLPGRLGSKPVDDEGVPSRKKILIKEGVLQ